MSKLKHPTVPGAELKYGGRTLSLTIIVNTDESIKDVVLRLGAAGKGPKQAMVAIVGSGELPSDEAATLWAEIWKVTAAAMTGN